jgi:deazaflavin-dependent oxidoreductase (nitroreductase family)
MAMSAPKAELPPAMLSFSRLPIRLLRWGVPLGAAYLLETRGRRTGRLRQIPIAVYHHDGRRWLVSIFGETGWVANIRASGTGQLRRGHHAELISVTEITDSRRAVVTMHLRRSFYRVNPFVRNAFAAKPGDGLAAFEAEAHRHPVSLIEESH